MSSLSIPAENNPAESKTETSKDQPKAESQPVPKEERTSKAAPGSDAPKSTSSGKSHKQTYPLYPSVQHLMKISGLPKEEADKIPATGPNGRLLKGDVLAYVGQIKDSYPSQQAERFKKLSHMDLSNIKVMAKKEAPAQEPAAAQHAAPGEELDIEVTMPISLTAMLKYQKLAQDNIGVFLPLTTLIAHATKIANEDLPKSKTAKPTSDELFDAVLGLDKVAGKQNSRGRFVPRVTGLPPAVSQGPKASGFGKPDVLDILITKKSSAPRTKAAGGAAGIVSSPSLFSVSVPKGDEKRGRVFLERVRALLEDDPVRGEFLEDDPVRVELSG